MVIKFQGKYVEANDPLRGRSIALFTKLFDNKHAPEKGYVIDEPGHIPAVYQGLGPEGERVREAALAGLLEARPGQGLPRADGRRRPPGQERLVALRARLSSTPITLQADADLTLRYQPLKGIYKEMLKGAQTAPATGPV